MLVRLIEGSIRSSCLMFACMLTQALATAPAAHALLAVYVFGEGASAAVLAQWTSQGIGLAAANSLSSGEGCVSFDAGLAQEQGGPCAILAAAQAMVVRRLVLAHHVMQPLDLDAQLEVDALEPCLTPGAEAAQACLLSALADILWHAASAPDLV